MAFRMCFPIIPSTPLRQKGGSFESHLNLISLRRFDSSTESVMLVASPSHWRCFLFCVSAMILVCFTLLRRSPRMNGWPWATSLPFTQATCFFLFKASCLFHEILDVVSAQASSQSCNCGTRPRSTFLPSPTAEVFASFVLQMNNPSASRVSSLQHWMWRLPSACCATCDWKYFSVVARNSKRANFPKRLCEGAYLFPFAVLPECCLFKDTLQTQHPSAQAPPRNGGHLSSQEPSVKGNGFILRSTVSFL